MRNSTVGVVGAGLMGREIALVAALADLSTFLHDASEDALGAAELHNASVVAGRRYDNTDRARLHGRLSYAASLRDLAGCTVVIEAVPEDAALKGEVLAALDRLLPADALIASNTSSLPIGDLAGHLPAARRGRFLGMHFSAPVSRMDFLEIIPGKDTDEAAVADAAELGRLLGKQPIFAKDVPGFAANRLLFALLAEAQRLVDEGVASVEDIDRACRLGLGHPAGPFEVMDHMSTALALDIHRILQDAYGDRFGHSARLEQLVRHGALGRKTGHGWRDY